VWGWCFADAAVALMVSLSPTGRRILACDDEPQILRALKVILRGEGYEVLPAANMEEALDVAAVSPVEAAILDLLLPDGDGIELCRRLREWSEMPIIVLSAVGDEEPKLHALHAGADDYMTKPFSPRELVARLEAVLRRASPEPEESLLTSDGLEIDLAAHVVRRDGEEIHLTRIEFELLRVLVRNRGRLLTHRMLLSEVWGPGYADDTQVLRTHIARLRRKIEPAGGRCRHYVRTETGLGFRFDPS
jgi:two-component system, OmpR family, KDP operon response regulator KdpE